MREKPRSMRHLHFFMREKIQPMREIMYLMNQNTILMRHCKKSAQEGLPRHQHSSDRIESRRQNMTKFGW